MLLFFVNIATKEIFRFMNEKDIMLQGVCILTFLSLIIILHRWANNTYLIIISILFYVYLIISSFSTSYMSYGVQKAYLGLLLPITLFAIFPINKWTEKEALKFLVLAILIIDIVAIVLKIRSGFFDRTVSFGLLGSIPFGWVNGMAFIGIVLQKEKKIKELIFSLFFFIMIIWTGSKGPLIGSVVICVLFLSRFIGKSLGLKIAISLLICLVTFLMMKYSDNIRSIRMIIDFFDSPEEYVEGTGSGSLGSRIDFLTVSLNLFLQNPIIGVGFGGWQTFSIFHTYPHNILFEILSETGIVGFLFFVLIIIKLQFKNIFAYICIYSIITLLFSGDFSYFRYAFFPFLVSFNIKNKL
jgi:O-antigen ligase